MSHGRHFGLLSYCWLAEQNTCMSARGLHACRLSSVARAAVCEARAYTALRWNMRHHRCCCCCCDVPCHDRSLSLRALPHIQNWGCPVRYRPIQISYYFRSIPHWLKCQCNFSIETEKQTECLKSPTFQSNPIIIWNCQKVEDGGHPRQKF